MQMKSLRYMNDRKQVEQFIELRSERLFRKIYRRYTPAMKGIAYRLLKNESAVDDVLQSSWLRAVKALDQFQWRSAFSTWLIGIVINCCSEYQRQFRHTSELDEEVIADQQKDHLNQFSLAIDLEKALKQLADGYRQVLMMYDIEGYSHKQIAEHLCIEVGTSKSQLSRARKQLQRLLEN